LLFATIRYSSVTARPQVQPPGTPRGARRWLPLIRFFPGSYDRSKGHPVRCHYSSNPRFANPDTWARLSASAPGEGQQQSTRRMAGDSFKPRLLASLSKAARRTLVKRLPDRFSQLPRRAVKIARIVLLFAAHCH